MHHVHDQTIQADGVTLVTQAFGAPDDPPVLLIMGGMSSMLWWPEPFCERLAARGRYVIRYDQRDTGLSTTYPPGQPGYTLDDMADDVVRILDGYNLPAAHLVGFSFGGGIAQLATLKHPERVITLTAMCTSPFDSELHNQPESAPDTDGATDAADPADAGGDGPPDLDLTNREQSIDYLIEGTRALAGTAYPFDEVGTRRLAEQDFDRAHNFASAPNHFQVGGGEALLGRLGEIAAPLLVLHGTEDPMLSKQHAIEFTERVPGTTLVWLEGVGHELPEPAWDTVIAAIARHTDDARRG